MTPISYLDERRTPDEILRIAGRFVDRACEEVEGHVAWFRHWAEAQQATEARERVEPPCDVEGSAA